MPGAFAPLALEVWVLLVDVALDQRPCAVTQPATSQLATVEALAFGGGDFLEGLADAGDFAARV